MRHVRHSRKTFSNSVMTHHALFFANNTYADQALRKLDGAERDAEELYGLFKRELGYQAEVLYAPSPDQVQAAVLALGQRVHVGDTLVFYFAGHGAERTDGKDQYLLLGQAQLRQLRGGYAAPAGVVSVNDLVRETDDWPEVARVFVFDACRVLLDATRGAAAAPLPGAAPVFGSERYLNELAAARSAVYRASKRKAGGAGTASGTGANLAGDDEPRALPPVFIKACLSQQEAREIPGLRRGVFSMALDDTMQSAKKLGHAVLTETGLLREVHQRMRQTAERYGLPADQSPWISEDAPEVLLFQPPRESAASPAAATKGLPALMDDFERQLAARQLDWPLDDCCVASLALMRMAGLGDAGLERYRQVLLNAREARARPEEASSEVEAAKAKAAVAEASPAASETDHVSELFKRFDQQLRAGHLISPPWDCCVGTLALLHNAGLGEGTLAMLQRQLEQPAPAPQPPGPVPSARPVPPPPQEPVHRPLSEMPAGTEFRDADWSPRMVVIPAGRFVMGSPYSEPERSRSEGPQREVQIRRAFGMGRTVVTFDDYDRYAKDAKLALPEDAGWGRGSRPVINVSWDDAQGYIEWLNARLGLTAQRGYRLPTEAEWEYAARAGTTTAFWWGDTISTRQANFDGNHTYADGSKGQYRQQTVPADAFEANPWGLYNVHGNVREWVQDEWHDDYCGAPLTEQPWQEGSDKARRVVRGGSWYFDRTILRSAFRSRIVPDDRFNSLGFRLARTL